jgi:hypothetical protein
MAIKKPLHLQATERGNVLIKNDNSWVLPPLFNMPG